MVGALTTEEGGGGMITQRLRVVLGYECWFSLLPSPLVLFHSWLMRLGGGTDVSWIDAFYHGGMALFPASSYLKEVLPSK